MALDLFIEKGFDGTSLREIAEKLGFTKAALYALVSVLFMAGDAFEGTTTQELGQLLRQTIHDILAP